MKFKRTILIQLIAIALAGLGQLNTKAADPASLINSPKGRNSFGSNVNVIKDIVYGTVKNYNGEKEKLKLDIYTPKGNQSTERKAIVWLHGGGFRPGNDKSQSYILKLCDAFAKEGYLCIAPDYRLRNNPQSDMKGTLIDAMNDVKLSLKWIQHNHKKYHIDPKHIIVGGGSAGGILMSNFCFKNNNLCKKFNIKAFINLWGSPDSLNFSSARYFPPTIFIHGTNDTIVPFQNSQSFASTLSKAGVYCELHPLSESGHTPVGKMDEIISLITDFLHKPEINLKP